MQKVKVSTNKTYKKIVSQISLFFQPLKLRSCVLVVFIDMNMYEGISKHSWEKIVQLLWIVVTYLLKNVKYGIEHDIAYGV